jgi:hypothetical protein
MSLQGCSEFNPVVLLPASEMGAAGDTSQRNAADAPNRRVVMFFFKAGTTVEAAVWPCPKVKEPLAACKAAFWPDGNTRRQNGPALREYKVSRDTMACRFYDRFARRSPCEGGAPVPVPPIVLTRTLQIRLMDNDGQPLAGLEYELAVGGQSLTGTTDATGLLKQEIPASVDTGILMTHLWSLALEIQDLDEDSNAGAKARLNNLGLHAGEVLDDAMDDLARRAVQRFKMLNGLAPSDGSAPSGDLDGPTKQKLKERHGS